MLLLTDSNFWLSCASCIFLVILLVIIFKKIVPRINCSIKNISSDLGTSYEDKKYALLRFRDHEEMFASLDSKRRSIMDSTQAQVSDIFKEAEEKREKFIDSKMSDLNNYLLKSEYMTLTKVIDQILFDSEDKVNNLMTQKIDQINVDGSSEEIFKVLEKHFQ